MNRVKLEKMDADEFYGLSEMKLVEKIQNADDDVERVLIINQLLPTEQRSTDKIVVDNITHFEQYNKYLVAVDANNGIKVKESEVREVNEDATRLELIDGTVYSTYKETGRSFGI